VGYLSYRRRWGASKFLTPRLALRALARPRNRPEVMRVAGARQCRTLPGIVLLIMSLLGLSTLQKMGLRKHHAGSIFASRAAPVARWLLGLFIAAYVLFIAFQMQHQLPPAMR
jgi:hypothetical protein